MEPPGPFPTGVKPWCYSGSFGAGLLPLPEPDADAATVKDIHAEKVTQATTLKTIDLDMRCVFRPLASIHNLIRLSRSRLE